MADVVIFGAGDIARLACHYFTHDSQHTVAAFAVDGAFRSADTFLERPLVDFADVARLYPPDRYEMFIALSYTRMNHARAEKYEEAKQRGYRLATYVSSRCTYLAQDPPGDNCFILEDNTIQPFVKIGSDVTLWSGNHIGHDSTIGDHCFISSHVVVSGHVHVQPYCFIGVNATLRNGLTIGSETLIGAGAVIMKDTDPKSVYVPDRTAVFPRTSDKVKL
jgi:sugar O-acyltransferase (sialic acid O-acetyltransferase NeuD family)